MSVFNVPVGHSRSLCTCLHSTSGMHHKPRTEMKTWQRLNLQRGNAVFAGVHTVNVVRNRPDLEQLREELRGLGASVVTTEDALKQDLAAADFPSRPLLGLNCVGGSSSNAVAKALGCARPWAAGPVLVTMRVLWSKSYGSNIMVWNSSCSGFRGLSRLAGLVAHWSRTVA